MSCAKRAKQAKPHQQIPGIITITDWARRAELEQKGLRVNLSFENISAISGTLTCLEVDAGAKLDHVERIEFDGEFTIASA